MQKLSSKLLQRPHGISECGGTRVDQLVHIS